MSVVIEISIVAGVITMVYVIKTISKKIGYRIGKKKLKKLLYYGFEIMDVNIIKNSIKALEDFDSKYHTKKLNKYLLNIVDIFRDDDTKQNLNEKNVLNLPTEFAFDMIFDTDEKEEELLVDEIDEKIEETKLVLSEVEKRRKEIMLRKNEIRQRQMGKSMKRRTQGSMG